MSRAHSKVGRRAEETVWVGQTFFLYGHHSLLSGYRQLGHLSGCTLTRDEIDQVLGAESGLKIWVAHNAEGSSTGNNGLYQHKVILALILYEGKALLALELEQ